MKTSDRTVCPARMALIVVLGLSVISVAGVFAGDVFASRGDDDSGSEVYGVVVGGDGAPLPGVLISISGGKVKQKTVTANDGAFSFASIPPGDYLVVFQAPGKKKIKRKIPVASEDVDLGTVALD